MPAVKKQQVPWYFHYVLFHTEFYYHYCMWLQNFNWLNNSDLILSHM